MNQGTSLAEVLCTTLLLALVLVVGSSLLVTAFRSVNRARAQDAVLEAAGQGLERMRAEVTLAQSIDTVGPTLVGRTPAYRFGWRCHNGQLQRQQDTGAWVAVAGGVESFTSQRRPGRGLDLELQLAGGRVVESTAACWIAP